MIGSLSQLIRGAAILAIEDGSEQITRDLLEAVPVDYAAERGATARPAAGRGRSGRAGSGLMRLPVAARARPARNRRLLPGPAGQPARPCPGRAVASGQQPAARNPPARRYP